MNYKILNLAFVFLLLTAMAYSASDRTRIDAVTSIVDSVNKRIGVGTELNLTIKVDNSTNSTTNTTGDMDIAEIEPNETHIVEVRERLSLSRETDSELVRDLAVREVSDKANFDNLARVTSLVRKEKKEVLAKEVLDMDRNFIDEVADIQASEEDDFRQQVDRYIDTVEKRRAVKVNLDSTKIERLFSKQTDIDSLMDELWNS